MGKSEPPWYGIETQVEWDEERADNRRAMRGEYLMKAREAHPKAESMQAYGQKWLKIKGLGVPNKRLYLAVLENATMPTPIMLVEEGGESVQQKGIQVDYGKKDSKKS